MKQVALYINGAARRWLVKYREELIHMFEWRTAGWKDGSNEGEVGTARWMSDEDLDKVVEILNEMDFTRPVDGLKLYELVTVNDDDETIYDTNKDLTKDVQRLHTETVILLDGMDVLSKGD